MCLSISKEVKIPDHDKDGYCVGYKMIRHNNHASYQGNYLYELGLNESGRLTIHLTDAEARFGQINEGFHILLDFKDALNLANCWREKIIKVYFKKKDIVDTGYFYSAELALTGKETGLKTVVVTKLLVKSLEDIKNSENSEMAIDNTVKIPKPNKEGYCVGYKSIRKDNRSSWRLFKYNKGVNVSDRPYQELTNEEKITNRISQGILVFLNLEEARVEAKHWREKVIKVYFKPEDVVATGTYTSYNTILSKNAVVMKVLIKSLTPIKEKSNARHE